MQQICRPLFKATGLTYFGYIRFYKSGYVLNTASRTECNKHYFLKKCYKSTAAVSSRLKPGYNLLSLNSNLSTWVLDLKTIFELDNCFEMMFDCGDYFESCFFAGPAGNTNIVGLYLNQLHLLTQFKFYFLEKAKSLIAEGSKLSNLIDLSKYVKNPPQITNESLPQALKYLQNNTKRYHIGPYKDQYLTKRELECLLYSLQGKNSVEIANILHISEKTVRSYLDLTKAKMEVSTKSELIQKAIDLGLLKLVKNNKNFTL